MLPVSFCVGSKPPRFIKFPATSRVLRRHYEFCWIQALPRSQLVSPVMYISFLSHIESIHNRALFHHVILSKGYHNLKGWNVFGNSLRILWDTGPGFRYYGMRNPSWQPGLIQLPAYPPDPKTQLRVHLIIYFLGSLKLSLVSLLTPSIRLQTEPKFFMPSTKATALKTH